MSGETESNISGWTTDTLHSHLNEILTEMDRRYEQRFIDSEKAVTNALNAAEKAVSKAEMASEKRFEGVNEFRAALSDSARQNVSRTEYDSAHQNVVEKIDTLSRRVERSEGTLLGTESAAERGSIANSRVAGYAFGALGAVIGAAGLIAAVLAK